MASVTENVGWRNNGFITGVKTKVGTVGAGGRRGGSADLGKLKMTVNAGKNYYSGRYTPTTKAGGNMGSSTRSQLIANGKKYWSPLLRQESKDNQADKAQKNPPKGY